MKQRKIINHYNNLIEIISDYKSYDCSCIKNTKNFKDLDEFLKSFFGSEFTYKDIRKLYYNCFIYKKYLIKFSGRKIPKDIPRLPFLVNTYYRENFDFICDNIKIYIGIEIQDYLYPNEPCNENEIYYLYKNLKNNGYEWVDASLSNAVKYNKKLYIVDTDYIYKECDANYCNQSKLSYKFKIKYDKEF